MYDIKMVGKIILLQQHIKRGAVSQHKRNMSICYGKEQKQL